MPSYTQGARTLSVTSPLGADVLLLQSFSGTESISRLFSYQLDLASQNEAITPQDIVGKDVTWSVSRIDKGPRYFNGFVCRFIASAVNRRGLRTYRAEVVPWPWFLTRTANCRIFQNLTTREIIETIFGDFGFSDYEFDLKGSYPKREYCVQYRETAFNFISRLLEHEGIFYFFRHEDGKHTLVMADFSSAYQDCPEGLVSYSPGSLTPNHVSSWEHHYEFRSGKWTRTDYNFETPSTSLLTTSKTIIDLPDAPRYEIFDYPGEYVVKGNGDPVTKVRMEEEEAGYNTVNAASQCPTFTPCGKFTLQKHDVEGENGDYMITSIRHAATEASYGSTSTGATYSNVFICIPAAVTFRPPRATPKPMVQGVQTAVVTGPPGEEIYVDKYGRVKVQFFWDRKGKKDAKSSCWIRVAEQSAGKGFGMIVHPRIGQEVVVDFLEGDPDRPLVTGRVYNAEQMPAYPLPGASVVMGLKSKTYKGSGSNEMSFDDTTGKEKITVHGQYDMNTTVGHNQTTTVHNNRTDKVDVDDSETVGSNQKIKIGSNQDLDVGSSQKIKVGSNRNLEVGGNQDIKVASNETTNIGSTQKLTVGADQKITVGAGRTTGVTGTDQLTVSSAQQIDVTGAIKITSGASITLTVGGSKISIGPGGIDIISSGNITITGAVVKVNS